jgi:hypothetical protein
MCLINNWLELRSDAFKMTYHTRRPVPSRVDTIGPWLENLVGAVMDVDKCWLIPHHAGFPRMALSFD